MADPATKRMTLDEFFWWDDGTETRYELIDGFPAAMAPPAGIAIPTVASEAGIL
jgi:Uma2 family endonuclease